MRQLVAFSIFVGGLLAMVPVAPAWAQVDASGVQLTARPTFSLAMAERILLAQAQDGTPTLGDEDEELSDEDFADFLDDSAPVGDNDPLESINRPIFALNLTLDRWILRPIARIYIETVPEPGRDGVANVLDNAKSPVVFANDLLQGELTRAGATLGRFFINTVFGLGGLFDTAGAIGLPGHGEDFGQTLGSYGVGGSPYLVLPLLGPSNPRDAIGELVDTAFDPLTYVAPRDVSIAVTGANLVSDRAAILPETQALEETSIDFYAAVRSFYYQNRDFEIRNQENGTVPIGFASPRSQSDTPVVDVDLYGDLEAK